MRGSIGDAFFFGEGRVIGPQLHELQLGMKDDDSLILIHLPSETKETHYILRSRCELAECQPHYEDKDGR